MNNAAPQIIEHTTYCYTCGMNGLDTIATTEAPEIECSEDGDFYKTGAVYPSCESCAAVTAEATTETETMQTTAEFIAEHFGQNLEEATRLADATRATLKRIGVALTECHAALGGPRGTTLIWVYAEDLEDGTTYCPSTFAN